MLDDVTRPLALALDFGGTKAEAALIDAQGVIVEGSRHRGPTGRDADSDALLASVLGAVDRALATVPSDATVVGAGIGSAGPISVADGTISPLNVPAWRSFPLREKLAQHTGLDVTLRTDGMCIALAEHWIGAGRGVETMMAMVVSTGIGGGIIHGGRLLVGRTGNAGHLGQLEIAEADATGAIGRGSMLEPLASGPHTATWARSRGWQGETGEDLARDAAAGDAIAREAIERSAHLVGRGIAAATALLDLELVAVGGGFSHVAPDYLDLVRASVAEHIFGYVREVRVVAAGLGGEAPLVGAAALVHRPETL